jgi:hypothetical protein
MSLFAFLSKWTSRQQCILSFISHPLPDRDRSSWVVIEHEAKNNRMKYHRRCRNRNSQLSMFIFSLELKPWTDPQPLLHKRRPDIFKSISNPVSCLSCLTFPSAPTGNRGHYSSPKQNIYSSPMILPILRFYKIWVLQNLRFRLQIRLNIDFVRVLSQAEVVSKSIQ